MPPLRPITWLLYSPVAVLPLLAALVVDRPVEGRTEDGFNMASFTLLAQHHWFWLAVTLGLGIWVGWYTAIDRAPAKAETEEDAP